MGRRVPSRVAEALLIALMGVGSVFLWLGIPAGWLYIASRLSDKYPDVYLLALVFCPLTMIVFGWLLMRVNGLYIGLFPEPEERRPRGHAARAARAWTPRPGPPRAVLGGGPRGGGGGPPGRGGGRSRARPRARGGGPPAPPSAPPAGPPAAPLAPRRADRAERPRGAR